MAEPQQMDIEVKQGVEHPDAAMHELSAPGGLQISTEQCLLHGKSRRQRRREGRDLRALNKAFASTSITKMKKRAQKDQKHPPTIISAASACNSSRTRNGLKVEAAELATRRAEKRAERVELVLTQVKSSMEQLQQDMTTFEQLLAKFNQADALILGYGAIKEEVKCSYELLIKQGSMGKDTTSDAGVTGEQELDKSRPEGRKRLLDSWRPDMERADSV